MPSLKQRALDLRGTRVRATFTHSIVEGELRFVTPAGRIVIAVAGSGGSETSFSLETLVDIEDARRTCAACGARVNRVFAGREDPTLLCVDCSRERAHDLPPPVMECEDCRATGAFRSPKTDAWRCSACHVRADTLSGLGAERRVLEQLEKTDPVLGAACRGADVNDMRHDWKRLRKSRWRCRRCHVDTYQEPAAYTVAQAEQDA